MPFTHPVGYELYLPANGGGGPFPLLVGLHGMGQRAEIMSQTMAACILGQRALVFPDGPLPFEKPAEGGQREEGPIVSPR